MASIRRKWRWTNADIWQKSLQKAMEASSAHADRALLQQAQQVMKLVQPQQYAQGKYNIQMGQAYGTVIGEHNAVNQQFDKQ